MVSSASGGGTLGRQVFHLERFGEQTLGDQTTQERLVEIFLRQADAFAAELAAGCEAGGPAFGDALHRLKNTAHFIAGERLLDAVAGAEAARPATLAGRRRAVTRIAREFALLRQALAQWQRERQLRANGSTTG